MQRDLEFTINLDDGAYAVVLLEGIQTETRGDVVTGHWAAFGLTAEADTEDEVIGDLVQALRRQTGADPAAAEFQPLADYVRAHGTLLSAEDVAEREVARYRSARLRWHITDDEQYSVQIFRDMTVVRGEDDVTVSAFGLDAAAPELSRAVQALKKAIDDADDPGITAWVRAHGERVGADILVREAEEKAAYLVARDQLMAIGPDDIDAESSTGIPLLVDFWAEWCAPCRMVTPVLAGLAALWSGRITVRKIDVDQYEGVWERYGFRGIPAMLLFQDGQEIHRVLGFGGKKALVAELEPHLPK